MNEITKELLDALKTIESWNSHTTAYAVDFGSNGVRDFYRAIARQSIAKAEAILAAPRPSADAVLEPAPDELRRMARKVGHPAGDVPAAMRAAADRLDELVRRLREAEKDAERYRWLRALPKGSCHGSGMTITIAKARPDPCSWMNDSVRGDDMDAAIDAAMQSAEAGD